MRHNPAPPPAPHQSEHGFTLIELVVSMTILALIMSLVTLSVQIMSDGWTRSGRAAGVQEMIARASDLLRRDLEGARRAVITRSGRKEFLFAGSQNAMTYLVREPPYPTSPGLYIVRLSAATDTPTLTRSRQPYKSEIAFATLSSNAILTDSVPILAGNLPFAFAYRGGRPTDTWQSAWSYPRRTPEFVRISIGPLPGSNATPEIIIHLKVDAEPGCVGGKSPLCSLASNGELQAISGTPAKPSPDAKNGAKPGEKPNDQQASPQGRTQ